MIELVFFVLVFYLAWCIGTNLESFASIVGSRVVSLRKALIIASIAVFIGACFFGGNVSKTLREEVTNISGDVFVLSVLAGAGFWIAFASWRSWNISTTASIVGSLVGVALFTGRVVNWSTVFEILLGWFTSPLIGFFLSFFFVIILSRLINFFVKGFEGLEIWELRLAFVQLVFTFFSVLVRAANDVAQAVFFFDLSSHVFILIAAFGMSVGLLTLGKNVVKGLGSRLTKLSPSSGLAVQLSTFFALSFFTGFGVPVSGSVIFVSAMAGAGFARGQRVNKSFLKQTVMSWIITMPVTAVISVGFFIVLGLF
ncbi:MAG: inorganic phosphate transporter [Nanoarchaeota archaeon]|nr:inorganic phosphate transporter [Nanoarchaeota archaeon]